MDTLEGASMSANAERRAASATVEDEDPSARWPGWLPVAAVGLVVVRRICGQGHGCGAGQRRRRVRSARRRGAAIRGRVERAEAYR